MVDNNTLFIKFQNRTNTEANTIANTRVTGPR